MTVREFLAAEDARDVLRRHRAADRASLREAVKMARDWAGNDGAERLLRWALRAYQ